MLPNYLQEDIGCSRGRLSPKIYPSGQASDLVGANKFLPRLSRPSPSLSYIHPQFSHRIDIKTVHNSNSLDKDYRD